MSVRQIYNASRIKASALPKFSSNPFQLGIKERQDKGSAWAPGWTHLNLLEQRPDFRHQIMFIFTSFPLFLIAGEFNTTKNIPFSFQNTIGSTGQVLLRLQ